jgi:hypothetical protein
MFFSLEFTFACLATRLFKSRICQTVCIRRVELTFQIRKCTLACHLSLWKRYRYNLLIDEDVVAEGTRVSWS